MNGTPSGFTRRHLILSTIATVSTSAAAAQGMPTIALFSKALSKYSIADMARIAADVGADSIDLTVRPDGHVQPLHAARDLPAADSQIRSQALRICIVNTEFTDASEPGAAGTLRAAGALGIPYFKLGYWRYGTQPVEKVLAEVRRAATDLVALGARSNVRALWHNHSGDNVGHVFWDLHRLTADWDPKRLGYLFDLSHAAGEGAVEGWQIALRLAIPRMEVVAAKDHTWEKVEGRWKRRTCALGQGAVDFPRAMALLAAGGFRGIFTIDCAYQTNDLAGSLAKDTAFVKSQIESAYGAISQNARSK